MSLSKNYIDYLLKNFLYNLAFVLFLLYLVTDKYASFDSFETHSELLVDGNDWIQVQGPQNLGYVAGSNGWHINVGVNVLVN